MNLAQMTTFQGTDEGVVEGRSLLATFAAEAIIRALQFAAEPSNFIYESVADEDDGNKITRKEGDALNRQNITGEPALGEQALYGKEYSIDDFRNFDQNVGVTFENIRRRAQKHMKRLMIDLRRLFSADIISGIGNAGTNEQVYGWSTIIADADTASGQTAFQGYTTSDIHGMLTRAEIDLTTKTKILQFMEILEREIALVPGANGLHVNNFLAGRIRTGARLLGVLGSTTDPWNIKVPTVFDVPLYVSNSSVIDNADSFTGVDLATSLYIVRHEEMAGLDYPSNSGFAYRGFADTDQPNNVSRIQIFTNTRMNDVDCLRRISRIGLSNLIDTADPAQ